MGTVLLVTGVSEGNDFILKRVLTSANLKNLNHLSSGVLQLSVPLCL